MAEWSIGSVADAVQTLVENIPSTISGAPLIGITDRVRTFMEDFTGDNIGSTAFAAKYQGAMVDLTASDLLEYMELVGVDVSNVKLGDLSLSQGAGGNIATAKQGLRKMGMRKLQELGHTTKFAKAFG